MRPEEWGEIVSRADGGYKETLKEDYAKDKIKKWYTDEMLLRSVRYI
jgi:hypothetical protein